MLCSKCVIHAKKDQDNQKRSYSGLKELKVDYVSKTYFRVSVLPVGFFLHYRCVSHASRTSGANAHIRGRRNNSVLDTSMPNQQMGEDNFTKEYEEPIPNLTDEENAYQKWQVFCQAFGIPCDVTYDEFLSNFAASGLEHIETYLVQCIEEAYEIYGETNVGEGKARPESVQKLPRKMMNWKMRTLR